MSLKKRILILIIVIFFISLIGIYANQDYQNTNPESLILNNNNITDEFGCCSIVLQLEGNHTMMSYRRDSNFTADINIEKINWHGIPSIKQYKTEEGYFSHVIITEDGWTVGIGGIDDGADSEKCEDIAAEMIVNDSKITKDKLKQIQKIKKPYERGHFFIKDKNGNYGFATVDKIKTGKMEPGEYKSLPNNYSLSRSGEVSLKTNDKVKSMTELAQSDKYGLDRRDIVTYDYQSMENGTFVDVYVSNEDGSLVNADYTKCFDTINFNNNTTISGEDIPIAPEYKKLGSISLSDDRDYTIGSLIIFIIAVLTVTIVSYGSYMFVKFIKFKILR